MKIPLVDLKANYLSIKEEVDQAIQRVIDNSSFIMGKDVEEFDKKTMIMRLTKCASLHFNSRP